MLPGLSPITDPRLLRKRTRSQGPFLRRHYPAWQVVRPRPTPARPAGSLDRPRRPSSWGFETAGCPTAPPVSYQINRRLSGWHLPPPVFRAFGVHCLFSAIPALNHRSGTATAFIRSADVRVRFIAFSASKFKPNHNQIAPCLDREGATRLQWRRTKWWATRIAGISSACSAA